LTGLDKEKFKKRYSLPGLGFCEISGFGIPCGSLVDMSTWGDDTGPVNYRPSHRWVKLSVRAPDAQPLSLHNSEGLL
jgi:hypothetical protein